MSFYYRPEQHMAWVPLPIDEAPVSKPGQLVAHYCILPRNHPVTLKLQEAGMGAEHELRN